MGAIASKLEPAVTCSICGNSLNPRFASVVDPQTLERFGISACKDCGLGHTIPIPADLSRYYGPQYYGGRHGITERYCIRRRIRLTETVAPRHGSLLDVGCGEATFLSAARSAGWKVAGTEMNFKGADELNIPVFGTLREAAAAAPFDCVTMWHSLEHIPDPISAFQQIQELLAPDGVLICAVPDAGGWQARTFGPHWFHLDVPRHLYHFGDRSLGVLFERTGYQVIRKWHQEWEYDVFGWCQSGLNKVFAKPNLFFSLLTGKNAKMSGVEKAANLLLGSLYTAAAVPATALATLAGQGGTIIYAGRKR